jgi:flavorubredoxin
MGVTNKASGTTIDEVGDGIFRISTPVSAVPGGFTFNQYLIRDEEPLLFHTGPKKMFPLVREAIASVLPPESLRWVSFSHYEADESGSLDELLALAPRAQALCGQVAAMVTINDVALRPPKALADGESISIGKKTVRWIDTPHLPHAWECGYLFETSSRTLLCGDLFTQGGTEHAPVVESDILGPSEAFRRNMDYFSHARDAATKMEKLATLDPVLLACMHGSAWRGNGAKLLRELGRTLG